MDKKQKILLITILIIGLPVAFLAPESRYVFLLLPLHVVISFVCDQTKNITISKISLLCIVVGL
ncbi:hypothetical protein ACIQD3_02130 [Peribacillus loiseleuriae]|uniref:hypothetical protein n=1 Tax=Peribacillus loiseleuriae TaxID=1679170 RepID=UPI00380047B6